MKLNVLIFYEHVPREIESVCLLKVLLEKRGFSVALRPWYFSLWSSFLDLKPQVVVVPFCYDDQNVGEFACFSEPVKILNLHYEQISQNGSPERHMPRGLAKEVCHISWGPQFTDRLTATGVNPAMIFETGSSNMDFYSGKLRDFVKTKEEVACIAGLNPKKRWVLILSHFAYAFLNEDEKAKLRLVNSYTDLKVKLARETYNITLDWIAQLAQACPDLEIIYRPHPAERITPELQDLALRYRSVSICPALVARDYITNSDVIFTWLSTAAIEAVTARKEIYLLKPCPIPENLMMPVVDCIPAVTDYQAFLAKCGKPSDDNWYRTEAFAKVEKAIGDIYKEDGSPAVTQIADAIEQIINDNGVRDFWSTVPKTRIIKGIIKEKIKFFLLRHLQFLVPNKKQQLRDYVPTARLQQLERAYKDKVHLLTNR